MVFGRLLSSVLEIANRLEVSCKRAVTEAECNAVCLRAALLVEYSARLASLSFFMAFNNFNRSWLSSSSCLLIKARASCVIPARR